MFPQTNSAPTAQPGFITGRPSAAPVYYAQQLPEFDTTRTQPTVNLRPYQEDSLAAIDRSIREGDKRSLAQLATGAGKTVIFSEYLHRSGQPGLILAHLDELLSQDIAKLRMIFPEADIGRIQAGFNETGHDITVASVQTISRPRRFNQAFPNDAAIARIATLITDEAHHSAAPTYRRIYEQFGLLTRGNPGSPAHLGFTATPRRGDGLGLNGLYDRVAFTWSIREGVQQGYLSDLAGYTLDFENEDMADVKTRAGEFDQGQLDKGCRKVARDLAIVEAWLEQAQLPDGTPRVTIAFCTSIGAAVELAECFSAAGVRSGVIHSDQSPQERQATLLQFNRGEIDVLCNCMILSEGFDCPAVSCVIMARPTKNTSLYIQCIGRGTRIYPGKANCLILDVSDTARRHKLDGAVSLRGALDVSGRGPLKSLSGEYEKTARTQALSVARLQAFGGHAFDPLGTMADVTFRWVKGGSGLLTLNLPKDERSSRQQWLVVNPRADLLWDIYLVRGVYQGYRSEQVMNVFGLPSSSDAVRLAEAHVLRTWPGRANLSGRDAAWRNRSEPASPKQLTYMSSLYRDKFPAGVSPYLTKSEAAILIDQKLAESVKIYNPRTSDHDVQGGAN